MGSVPAAWIIDTAAGEADSSVTSHELATSRMKLPVLPSTVAVQMTVKTICWNGAKALDVAPGFAASLTSLPSGALIEIVPRHQQETAAQADMFEE